jgi:hypothetical protein
MREGSMIPPELRAELDAAAAPKRSRPVVLIALGIVAAVAVVVVLIVLAAQLS